MLNGLFTFSYLICTENYEGGYVIIGSLKMKTVVQRVKQCAQDYTLISGGSKI